MKVLVVNCGSSSLKFRLIETDSREVIAKGLCERIGIDGGHFEYSPAGGSKVEKNLDLPNHDVAVKLVIDTLTDAEVGVVKSLEEIDAVGHRIVHGGDKFKHAAYLDDEAIKEIEDCAALAPLHNPVNLIGIRACQKAMPGRPNVAAFDTSFHQTLPEEAYLYGIPYEYYKKDKIRRYGFHGMSHEYVAIETAKELGRDIKDTKIITCHLGNGASITAVDGGKSIDTSMGFTPLDGIIMGTRCGSLDPEIINFIAGKYDMSIKEVLDMLNKKSGLYGLSNNLSTDMRDLTDAYKAGDENAVRALKAYAYRIIKYIGAYATVLGGVDAITFTAGIGEHSFFIRDLICQGLGFLGVELDDEANKNCDILISTPNSKIKVYAIPTDEEMSIALQTVEVLKNR